MGFNKRWINLDRSIRALKEERLSQYYGKGDTFFFQDETSLLIYNLYTQGNTDKQILTIINKKNMEETNHANEVY